MTDIIVNFVSHLTLNDLNFIGSSFEATGLEEDLVAAIWRLPAAHEYLSLPLSSAVKSEAEADRLRNEGTANFIKRRYDYAVQLFNHSLRVAPHPPLTGPETDPDVNLSKKSQDGTQEVIKQSHELSANVKGVGDNLTDANGSQDLSKGIKNTVDSSVTQDPLIEVKVDPDLPNNSKDAPDFSTSDETGSIMSVEDTSYKPDALEFLVHPDSKDSTGEESVSGAKPPNTEPYQALAKGYGNRSAAFFHMEKYHACIRDVDRALKYSKEEAFQKKLLKRKDECLEAIKRHGVKEIRKNKYSRKQLESPNPDFPTLSTAVRVDYSEKTGRRLVAARDIVPGELIMVEEAHWEMLAPQYETVNCSNCGIFCDTPVPCPTCHLVIFCNEECRTKGMTRFHSRECALLPTIKIFEEMPAVLAARIVLMESFTKLRDTMQEIFKLRAEGKKNGIKYEGTFDPSVFRNLVLSDNRIERPMPKHQLAYGAVAVAMTKAFQDSGKFFVDQDGQVFQPSEDDLRMTASTLYLLTLTGFVYSNSFIYNEKIHGGENLAPIFKSGIYPTNVMCKKSCCPSCIIYNCGSSVLMRSVLFIQEGEMLTSYGTEHYTKVPYHARKKGQAEFGIHCDCIACTEEWPVYESLPDSFSLKCPKCSHPLNRSVTGNIRCQHHTTDRSDSGLSRLCCGIFSKQPRVGEDMEEMRDPYAVVDNFLRRQDQIVINKESEENIRHMTEVIRILQKHGVLPCKLYHDVQDLLLRSLSARDFS